MENRPITYPALLRRVLGYLRPHRARLSGGLAMLLVGIGFELIKPVPQKLVLDWLEQWAKGNPGRLPAVFQPWLAGWNAGHLLVLAFVAIILFAMFHGLSALAANYITIDIGQRMVNDLRTQLYSHLQKLSLKFHYQQRAGDLLFRVMSDTFSIQSVVMNGLLPLATASLTLIGMFWVMAYLDLPLALMTILVCPFLYFAISRLSRRIHGHAAASREAESELYCRAESTIGAVKLVQAYGREERAVAEFRRGSERSLALSLRLYSVETLFGLVVDSLLATGPAVIICVGAVHVMRAQISLGTLILFLNYLKDLYNPIHEISQNLAELSASRAGLERAFAVLDVLPDIRDAPGARPLGPVRGEITLDHVTFSYGDGPPVLCDIDLRIEPGETVALVGRTGAGKTTLAGLVPRFFDPQQGRVLIDGHDVRDVQLASLRRQVTLMLQEPILFHTTVADNIAFGSDAALERIREAARRAEAEGFVMALPQGYDSVLGEDGMTLSGGQRQRLALARALLRETPILIFDEPTSSLDTATEALVWGHIETLLEAKTAIIIAHRLSTARMADRIVVLDDGRIVEQGTHDELLARRGPYHGLWQRHALSPDAADGEPALTPPA